MGKEIAFENGQISDFQGLVTLTLTLDRVILRTVMHHSTYTPNFIEIEATFCGRTDGHSSPTLLDRLGGVDLKKLLTVQPNELSSKTAEIKTDAKLYA